MVYTLYHLSVGICANWYPFSHIPSNKWYSPHHRTLKYCKVQRCDHYHLSVGISDNVPRAHLHIYLLIDDTWLHRCTSQYCKVQWCWLYHLLVGIYENGYTLAHIPTNKWYMLYTFALYNTNNCDVVPSSNLHDVHLPNKSPTV